MKLCREYMKPNESIILNVVSTMVDFSTSASLQMSRELDSNGDRTMLRVTKVDQHQENGLHEKINNAVTTMHIKPENIFAVQNCSQKENNEELPLSHVQRLEMEELRHILNENDDIGYGLRCRHCQNSL